MEYIYFTLFIISLFFFQTDPNPSHGTINCFTNTPKSAPWCSLTVCSSDSHLVRGILNGSGGSVTIIFDRYLLTAFRFDNLRHQPVQFVTFENKASESSKALIKLEFRINSPFLCPLTITSSLSGTCGCNRSLQKKYSWVVKC